jgi:hypothetical protein
MVGPSLALASLFAASISTARAEDPVRGFEYATVALEEVAVAQTSLHEAHDKRLRRSWGPSPECLLGHARDVDARVAVVERERGALAELVAGGHSGKLVEQRVERHIRAVAIARAHVRQTVEQSDECPLVRTKRQKRRDREPQDAEQLARR